MRYPRASSDAVENRSGWMSPSSPASIATIPNATPPHSISIPTPTNGRLGSGAWREYSDPDAQLSEAPRANSIPSRSTPPPLAELPTRSAAPANPVVSPTSVATPSRCFRSTRSTSAIHSGTRAMIRATMPEGTVRSAHTTPPFPPRSSAHPTMAAARHWRGPGRSPSRSPRRMVQANMTVPATRNLMDAERSGGIVWLTMRMAKYVVPHTM